MTLDNLVSDLSNLKVSDLVRLTRRLEEDWGVSAQTVQPPVVPIDQVFPEDFVGEQVEFAVRLDEIGPRKIEVIKVVREILPHLTLVDAKKTVESAPFDVVSGVGRQEADLRAEKLRAVGAIVSVY